MRKKSIKDMKQLATLRGGKCLSNEYIGSHTKLIWQCSNNHIWQATYGSISQNHWCPKCRDIKFAKNQKMKNGLTMAKEIASTHGGKCLSDKYVSTKTKMLWECKYGHKWEAPLSAVKYRNTWCLKCAINNTKNTIEDAKKIALMNNGICLSNKYINSRFALIWKCQSGHIWKTSYYNVRSGTWCPQCSAKKNVSQIKLYETIKEIYPNHKIYLNYRGFEWLKNLKTNRRLEIDIYLPELKLAIEYDGEQHFRPMRFKNAKEKFEKVKKLDKLKEKKINQHPEDIKYFIRFNYKDSITKDYVIKKLEGEGI